MERIYNITTLGSTDTEVSRQAADVAAVQRQMRLARLYEQADTPQILGSLVDVRS